MIFSQSVDKCTLISVKSVLGDHAYQSNLALIIMHPKIGPVVIVIAIVILTMLVSVSFLKNVLLRLQGAKLPKRKEVDQ